MTCLYASDYGPADPAFDPLAGGGLLLDGFESHRPELARAQNLGQLQAMERQLQRNGSIAWCDQGYAWAEGPAVEGFLVGFSVLVVLPYTVKRLAPRLWRRSLKLLQRVHQVYIWFRFDWQFGVGVVGTLLLDITKTVGFFAVTQLQFDINSVAAIMLLIGYSVTDKIVVYDRIRENLRKDKSTPLRELIDRSINQTLGRTVVTSTTVLLSIVPLAIIGGEAIRSFAVTIIFGIVVGTSSSIFIASPILLFLGQKRLRPGVIQAPQPSGGARIAKVAGSP